jgi:hypothetical protein
MTRTRLHTVAIFIALVFVVLPFIANVDTTNIKIIIGILLAAVDMALSVLAWLYAHWPLICTLLIWAWAHMWLWLFYKRAMIAEIAKTAIARELDHEYE